MRTPRLCQLESRELLSGTTSLYAQPFAFDVNLTPNAISANNNWSGVPGLTGYSGAGLASPGVDPRTVVADGSGTPVQVWANADPLWLRAANPPTGLAEFDSLPDAMLAVRPGANAAPHLLLQLDTRGTGNIIVGYRLTDLDATGRDSASAFALQYRVGGSGSFVNVPGGFVADATEPGLAGKVTPVQVTLPAEASGQPLVQLRILTADPGGPAEWVGIDGLQVRRDAAGPSRVHFTVDQPNSKLAVTGEALGLTLNQQGTNSLNSSYTGKIAVDLNFVTNAIGFVGSETLLDASITGNWQPQPGGASGSAPADYGGILGNIFAGVYIALRNVLGTLDTEAPLALGGTGTTLNYPSQQKFNILQGTVDYRAVGLLAGSVDPGTTSLAGASELNQATTAGTLSLLGNDNFDLIAPVLVNLEQIINGQPAKFKINGTINTANAALPVVDPNGAAAGETLLISAVGGGPAVVLMPAATVTRTPSANLTGLTLTLDNVLDGAAEKLAVDLTGTGLATTGYDPASRTLAITGPAAASVYQSVLQKVTYQNTAATANAGQPDFYRVPKNGRLAVGGAGVAANDFVNRIVRVSAADAQNSSRTQAVTIRIDESAAGYSLVSGPAHGTLTFNPNGTFVYTPNANFVGDDTFAYKADGDSTAIPVTVTVVNANSPPVNVVPGPLTVAAGKATAITGLGVSDPDAGAAELTMKLSVGQGALTLNAGAAGGVPAGQIVGNGTAAVTITGTLGQLNATLSAANGVVYTPTGSFTGADVLTVETNDNGNSGPGGPQITTATVALTVAAPPRVAQAVTNDGQIQRSRVGSARVTFDSAVTLVGATSAEAFTLTGPGGAAVSFTADVTATNPTVVRITFPPLADGRYVLTVLAAQVVGPGGQLDGNGDGVGGDNFAFNFHRLFGDADGNATVNFADFLLFRGAFGVSPADPTFDFDGDGLVNFTDFLQFRTRFGTSI